MRVAVKFLRAALVWTGAIFLLIVPVTVATSEPLTAVEYVRWLGRALGLAAFPAGIAAAGDAFGASRPWRALASACAAAGVVALLVFALFAFVVPPLGNSPTLRVFTHELGAADNWESRNHAAWILYTTLLAPVSAVLYALIGLQVGVWATHSLPVLLRRLLYWMVGLGLLVSAYSVYDITYETVILHTAADASFAAFYTLLVPLGICAGLGLPTLALLRGAEVRVRTP